MQPYLIGIAGPSCSGKSEVSRRLARILRAPILAIDHYYRDLQHMPFEERVLQNVDVPAALDDTLILEHVAKLQRSQPVEEPVYDFVHHVRTEETQPIQPADYILVEGLFTLYWPELRNLLNFSVYISADHETCLTRRIFRDVRERGRTEQSVREQYEQTVRPMADLYVTPSMASADLVLAGVAPVKQSVYTILLYIADRLSDHDRVSTVRNALSSWSPELVE